MRTTLDDLYEMNDLLGQHFRARLASGKPLNAAMARCLLQWLKQNGITVPTRPKAKPLTPAEMTSLMEGFSPPEDGGTQ